MNPTYFLNKLLTLIEAPKGYFLPALSFTYLFWTTQESLFILLAVITTASASISTHIYEKSGILRREQQKEGEEIGQIIQNNIEYFVKSPGRLVVSSTSLITFLSFLIAIYFLIIHLSGRNLILIFLLLANIGFIGRTASQFTFANPKAKGGIKSKAKEKYREQLEN